MKLFTRLLLALLTIVPMAAALAGTVTVTVGDNFYRSAANGSSTITIAPGDVLVFQYAGNSSHPTVSDSSPAAWPTFQMNSSNRTKTFAANTFAVGSYPFHCAVHSSFVGGAWLGQTGTLVVQNGPTATADARPSVSLNLYPNPSKGLVTLQLNQKTGQDCKLRLSNIIGQEVRTVALKPELSETGLDLRDLPTGMYFYSLVVDGKVVSTKRLVLQN